MQKKPILDAVVFIENRYIEGITIKEVLEEVKTNKFINTEIKEPKKEFIEKVKKMAEKTRDLDVLSNTDIKLIALALQENAPLITDDFAIQNVCKALGIEYIGLNKEIRERREWIWYCPICKREYDRKGVCKYCGIELKRKPKDVR